MDSFFARNRLSAYLDGALSDAEAAELSEAIERDPRLQAEYAAMQQAVELLRREGPTQAPSGFHARVMEKVADEPGTGGVVVQLRRWWNRVPVEAVALAAAAAVVVLVIQGKPGQPEEALSKGLDDLELLPSSRRARPGPDAETAAAAGTVAEEADGTEGDLATRPAEGSEDAVAVAGADGDVEGAPAQAAEPAPKKKQAVGKVDPYVADWEQGPAGGEMATPVGYRLDVANPEVLYTLSRVAETSGGAVRDSSGRVMQPSMLSQTEDYAQPMIVVPRDQVDVVRGHLEALGGRPISAGSVPSLFPVEYGVFVVEVRFRP